MTDVKPFRSSAMSAGCGGTGKQHDARAQATIALRIWLHSAHFTLLNSATAESVQHMLDGGRDAAIRVRASLRPAALTHSLDAFSMIKGRPRKQHFDVVVIITTA